ncbi:uncharacterized protein LOC111443532 [Cucurbita moschata]|uniref:Uncharacterized protein LOC111443532 n=1 Tax=Cucurbita moschata TaxID=3662 RepID=A0A6J1FAB3_CUCMO|nr:uncharacterized protein LOC111443532 [Cucurbita moschata]
MGFPCSRKCSPMARRKGLQKKVEGRGGEKGQKSRDFDLVKSCKHEQTQHSFEGFVGFLSPHDYQSSKLLKKEKAMIVLFMKGRIIHLPDFPGRPRHPFWVFGVFLQRHLLKLFIHA